MLVESQRILYIITVFSLLLVFIYIYYVTSCDNCPIVTRQYNSLTTNSLQLTDPLSQTYSPVAPTAEMHVAE